MEVRVFGVFKTDVVNQLLHKEDMDLVVRAHQVVEDGYANRHAFACISFLALVGQCRLTIDENLVCSFMFLYIF